jgi:hypothetical protein
MKVAAADGRVALRHNLKSPGRARISKSAIPDERTKSENLSEKGDFFATDSLLRVRRTAEMLLEMPEEITGEPTTEWISTSHFVHVAGQLLAGATFCWRAVRSLSDFAVHDRLARGSKWPSHFVH